MNIVVREALQEEAQLIAELTRASWLDKVAATSRGHHEEIDRVLKDLRIGGGYLLLVDHMAVGSVRWAPIDTNGEVWEILRMGIIPEFRGHNLSQHLLEAVIHQAQACLVKELILAVRAGQQKLIDFYAAFGFEIAPEVEYPSANPAEQLPNVMRKLLQ